MERCTAHADNLTYKVGMGRRIRYAIFTEVGAVCGFNYIIWWTDNGLYYVNCTKVPILHIVQVYSSMF